MLSTASHSIANVSNYMPWCIKSHHITPRCTAPTQHVRVSAHAHVCKSLHRPTLASQTSKQNRLAAVDRLRTEQARELGHPCAAEHCVRACLVRTSAAPEAAAWLT